MPARSAAAPGREPSVPPESGQLQGFGAFLGILSRFIVCGLLSLAGGLIWRFTLAPAQVGIGSAMLGILCLLAGFVIGGMVLYIRDARLRTRHPERVSDERIIFSFIVFAMVPLAVGSLIGLIYLLALVLGG